jgi:NADH-ubiquinone oxidoreductase chain 5
MNRGGDMLMSIGFFAIFSIFGSLNYYEIFSAMAVPFINNTSITLISLLLLGGALAKSANIPLHSWLPGSMEAPTPVSALLHAATLVTAGIYLLIRVSPILEYSSTALLVITIIGATTAFIAATSGLLANDLKRIIAFSTISQLGYMMMAIGLSQYNVALMHTVNHAFFKALLFLGAGAVIHSLADQQDIRKMGGLIKILPFTYSVMLTGTLSLLATPYLTGFYSKDLILELAYGQYNFSGIYAYILGSLTAGITAFYSFRLISLVFLTSPNGNKQSYFNSLNSYPNLKEPVYPEVGPCGVSASQDSVSQRRSLGFACYPEEGEKFNLIVILPLLILALFSIFFGFVFSDLFTGMGSDFFQNSIFMHPNKLSLIEADFFVVEVVSVNIFIKLLPTLLTIIGAFSAIILYHLPVGIASGIVVITESFFPEQEQHHLTSSGSKATADSFANEGKKKTGGLFLINLSNNKLTMSLACLARQRRFLLAVARKIYAFLNGKYYFDVIYNHFIFQAGFKLGYSISKEIDRGAIELLGPYGLSINLYNTGKDLANLDTGVITTYSLYITIALISLLFILFSPLILSNYSYLNWSSSGEATAGATGSNYLSNLEEFRLFIIYITSSLIVLSPLSRLPVQK